MARQIEASQAWLESITYQMNTMTHKEQQSRLGGAIALLKAQASTVFEYCAREAAQIFGGLSYTRGGQGEKVERLYREVRAYAIPAGSEEISTLPLLSVPSVWGSILSIHLIVCCVVGCGGWGGV